MLCGFGIAISVLVMDSYVFLKFLSDKIGPVLVELTRPHKSSA